MELRQYAMIARRWAWLVLLAMLIAGVTTYVLTIRQPKLYRADAILLINQPQAPGDPASTVDVLASQNLAQTYATLATSWPVIQHAAQNLGLDPEKAQINATATVPLNTQLLNISVVSRSPRFAREAANAVATAFVDALKQTQLLDTASVQNDLTQQLAAVQANIQNTTDQISQLSRESAQARLGLPTPPASTDLSVLQTQLNQQQSTYATLSGQLAQLKIAQAKADNGVRIVAPARDPKNPFSPRPLLNAAIASLLGLVLGASLALLLEYLDDRVQTPQDVEAAANGAPTLGIVERLSGSSSDVAATLLLNLSHPSSRAIEAYRLLRSNLEFVSASKPVKSLLVTSARPNEGKTTTAANLAIALSQTGRRVLLVDGDFRRPSLHRLFGMPNSVGLSTLFLAPGTPVRTLAQQTPYENLFLLPTGPVPPNPAELVSSVRMVPIIDELKSFADFVVLDSPPLLAVADASELAARVDGAVLVVDTSSTRPRELAHARESLERAGARFLGVALNKLKRGQTSRSDYYYNYYYSSGDDYGSDRNKKGHHGRLRSSEPAVATATASQGRNGHDTQQQ